MTTRDRILAKPKTVQVVLKVYMTKVSLDDSAPDWDLYGKEALIWWEHVCRHYQDDLFESSDIAAREIEIARRLIEGLRKQEVWGKILREGTQ